MGFGVVKIQPIKGDIPGVENNNLGLLGLGLVLGFTFSGVFLIFMSSVLV